MKRVLVACVLAACAGRAKPSAPVQAEVAKAETAEKARKHDEARKHYQAAIASAKDAASIAFARREFADTLISWGEYPEAIVQLEGVTYARPDDPSAWNDLGLLYFNSGDAARAIQALEKSRSLAPEDERPRTSLALIRYKRGDLVGAREEYQQLLELQLSEKKRAAVEDVIVQISRQIAARQPSSP